MKAVAPFVILAVVLAGCGPEPASTPATNQSASKEPVSQSQQPAKMLDVEIVGAVHPKLLEVCKDGRKPANTIFVDTNSRKVFHCVTNAASNTKTLTEHVDHGPVSPLSEADVPLSAGQQVRWFSETHTFSVLSVVKGKENPQAPAAPPTPFDPTEAARRFTKVAASEVISPPVLALDGDLVQRYKVTFQITGLGLVDPDLICSM
jgi:hypothetical protein